MVAFFLEEIIQGCMSQQQSWHPCGCHTLASGSKSVVGVANVNVANKVSTRQIQCLQNSWF